MSYKRKAPSMRRQLKKETKTELPSYETANNNWTKKVAKVKNNLLQQEQLLATREQDVIFYRATKIGYLIMEQNRLLSGIVHCQDRIKDLKIEYDERRRDHQSISLERDIYQTIQLEHHKYDQVLHGIKGEIVDKQGLKRASAFEFGYLDPTFRKIDNFYGASISHNRTWRENAMPDEVDSEFELPAKTVDADNFKYYLQECYLAFYYFYVNIPDNQLFDADKREGNHKRVMEKLTTETEEMREQVKEAFYDTIHAENSKKDAKDRLAELKKTLEAAKAELAEKKRKKEKKDEDLKDVLVSNLERKKHLAKILNLKKEAVNDVNVKERKMAKLEAKSESQTPESKNDDECQIKLFEEVKEDLARSRGLNWSDFDYKNYVEVCQPAQSRLDDSIAHSLSKLDLDKLTTRKTTVDEDLDFLSEQLRTKVFGKIFETESSKTLKNKFIWFSLDNDPNVQKLKGKRNKTGGHSGQIFDLNSPTNWSGKKYLDAICQNKQKVKIAVGQLIDTEKWERSVESAAKKKRDRSAIVKRIDAQIKTWSVEKGQPDYEAMQVKLNQLALIEQHLKGLLEKETLLDERAEMAANSSFLQMEEYLRPNLDQVREDLKKVLKLQSGPSKIKAE